MKRLQLWARQLWMDESGQGTAEYVLLIAIVVGLVIMFKDKIMGALKGKIDETTSAMGQITPNGN